jgi:hypothetical protein
MKGSRVSQANNQSGFEISRTIRFVPGFAQISFSISYMTKMAESYMTKMAERSSICEASSQRSSSSGSNEDCPQIRRLYQGWATIGPFGLRDAASDGSLRQPSFFTI